MRISFARGRAPPAPESDQKKIRQTGSSVRPSLLQQKAGCLGAGYPGFVFVHLLWTRGLVYCGVPNPAVRPLCFSYSRTGSYRTAM